jgi:phosphate transport system substrate-binding protein
LKGKSVLMKLHHLILFVILSMFPVTACSSVTASEPSTPTPTPAGPLVTFTLSGSGSATGVLSAVEADFEADTPGYQLEVLPGSGTGGGVKGIVGGVLDVAGMARPPKDEEAAQGVEYVSFGQAGQAVITHPEVGIDNLTAEQVKAIFSGEVTQWSDVGGPDIPIVLYVRDEGDSSTKALRAEVMGDTPFADTVAQVLTSQGDMLASVSGTPGSVGIATWPTALASGTNVQPVKLDGIAPGNPTYPMVSPLGIGYLTERKADVQPLIDWLTSEQGKAALQEFDMITE